MENGQKKEPAEKKTAIISFIFPSYIITKIIRKNFNVKQLEI